MKVPHISTDKGVKYDYDIVYVRLPRKGFRTPGGKFESPIWAQAGVPLQMHPGADLMLLQPDGSEEVLFRPDLGIDSRRIGNVVPVAAALPAHQNRGCINVGNP